MHFDNNGIVTAFRRMGNVLLLLLLTFVLTALPALAQQNLYAPVAGAITSNFGWRHDPMGAGSRFHAGVDIAASSGTPIYAPQNAYVAYSGQYKGYGNVVVLDHGYGVYTLYGHASALYVKAGQAVGRGQAIAAVGSTGRSTGPHLHFEVHQNGKYVDPLVYLSYLAQSGPSNPMALSQPQPMAAQVRPAKPIEVSMAQPSQQFLMNQPTGMDVLPAESTVPQALLAQAPEEVGKPLQGVTIPVQKAVTKAPAPKSPNRQNSKTAYKTGKRVSRYLVSSAVQVVSGKKVNWVRF